MYKLYYESSGIKQLIEDDVPTLLRAKSIADDYYGCYKKLREGGFVKCIVCVRIYDENDEMLVQYGSI